MYWFHMVSAFSHFTLLVTSVEAGHCLLKPQWKWTEAHVKWFKESGVVSGLTISSGRRQTESKRLLCSQKHEEERQQDLPSHLRSSHLVLTGLCSTSVRTALCMRGGVFVDRERLMSKSEDSFPLPVQTWEFCGGFLLVRAKWGRNCNCGIWVLEGVKDWISWVIGWLKHRKKGEFKGGIHKLNPGRVLQCDGWGLVSHFGS